MKIILNTKNVDLVNFFLRISKTPANFPKEYEDKSVEVLASRVEAGLFEHILDPTVDAYLIEAPASYSQKAVDFIKKKTPYIPVILFGNPKDLAEVSGADIYLPSCPNILESESSVRNFFDLVVWNAANFLKNFKTLRKLTTKMADVIEFGQCRYDPTRRVLAYKEKEVKKLSAKEGGILEVLASNFGEVVKKEIILEKVWHKSDYFSGRSMDVYVTHLRSLLKNHSIDMTIKNISGVGLILE
jgi:DNA-binding winged helix-turn-helix (wHTH) protein